MLEESGIGISKWREVVKCLKTYMELDTICVSERMYSQLGTDIVDVKTGNFKFRKNDGERYENIKYWVTDADQHLIRN